MEEDYTNEYMTLMDKISEYGSKNRNETWDIALGRKTYASENESQKLYEEIAHEIMKLVYFHQHKVETR